MATPLLISPTCRTVLAEKVSVGGRPALVYKDSRYKNLLNKTATFLLDDTGLAYEKAGTGTNESRYLTDGKGHLFIMVPNAVPLSETKMRPTGNKLAMKPAVAKNPFTGSKLADSVGAWLLGGGVLYLVVRSLKKK